MAQLEHSSGQQMEEARQKLEKEKAEKENRKQRTWRNLLLPEYETMFKSEHHNASITAERIIGD
jgi:hypothetical protein